MSAMEQTRYYQLGSNALAFDKPRRYPEPSPSADSSSDDSLPLFLSDYQNEHDPRKFAPSATSQRTSILTRIVAGGMAVSAFAILGAVLFPTDVTRVLVDKARVSMAGTTANQSAVQTTSNQPAARQVLLKDDLARPSDPGMRASRNTSAPRPATESRDDTASADRAAPQRVAPRAGNEGAVSSKSLDAETLAALKGRAKGLLALGDIAGARLLLERAATAQDATAAFLLAQSYDPAVLGAHDTRSITPDPAMARDWYRKAASFGSKDAQRRLIQFQN